MKTIRCCAAPVICAVLFLVSIHGFVWADSPAQNAPELQKISGQVLDPSGAPLARTMVEVRDGEGKLVAVTQTNSRGEYSLELARGEYSLTATLAGFAPIREKPLKVPAESTVPLTLQVSSPLYQVVVTATQTETPLAQVGSSVTVIPG